MAKRIATQLAEEIEDGVEDAIDTGYSSIHESCLKRWLKWAKALDARMRLDGSKLNRKRKAKPAK